MPYCHGCGFRIPDNAGFCANCGHPVEARSIQIPLAPRRKSAMRLRPLVIWAVILIVAAALITYQREAPSITGKATSGDIDHANLNDDISGIPPEANALAGRWIHAQITQCGDSYIGTALASFDTSGSHGWVTEYHGKDLKIQYRDLPAGPLTEAQTLNGIEDVVQIWWTFSEVKRNAEFTNRVRSSEWGLWNPPGFSLGTPSEFSLSLYRLKGKWQFTMPMDLKVTESARPLTCEEARISDLQ